MPFYSFSQSPTTAEDESILNENNENSQEQAPQNETISIIATGNARDTFSLPMQVNVIENSGSTRHATTASQLLRNDASVQITGTQRTNGQNITLRGYDKRGVLLLVDGISQGTDTGHIDGTFIDSSLIKQVEIVKGSSGLLYGSGALGGVIAYQTVDASSLLREGESFGGTHFIQGATGDNSVGSGITLYGKTDEFDALFSGVLRERGNLKQADFTSPNDEVIGNIMTKANWYLAEGQKLTGQIRYYQNESEQPKNPQQNETGTGPAATPESLKNSLVDRKTSQTDYSLSYSLKPTSQDWLDLTLSTYYQKVTIDQDVLENSTREERKQTKQGIKLENKTSLKQLPLAAHTLTYGTEFYREEQTPNETVQNVFPKAKIDFSSGWLQDEVTLKDLPVTLIGGARFDEYHAKNPIYPEVKSNNWSSKAGISLTPVDWFMVYGSYSEAFRAPSLSELYNDSKHFSIGPFYTNNWVPNPNLRPETNSTFEYGFGLRFDDLLLTDDEMSFKASYFDTKADDYISSVVNMNFSRPPAGFPPGLPFGKGTTTSQNISRASIWGYEAQFNYQTHLFDSQISYSRVKGRDDTTQNWIESLSPDTLSSSIDIPVKDTGFSVSWTGQFVDKSTRVNDETKPQAGYGLNHFYINYENNDILPNLFLSVGLDNAFNKAYYSPQGIPGNNRSAQFKASYSF
ncbi:TonB-dependent hemoglobin/transferrin/lactoferrin family receptor [Thorsellia kenyensis]|uniref:TonB-dependent hemoglobin/transferrin/lactoferrin family receptor n=1 Tax=Thorsellia kenyensis TaxID=1549888 RepID=A0ABV6CA26_9GAMM